MLFFAARFESGASLCTASGFATGRLSNLIDEPSGGDPSPNEPFNVKLTLS
jgi:hypothetical protein